ncbi:MULTISPECIES: immunoglobulin domain-containing protein [unclassified Vibrio]|uniref:immunoglobulin domain-containing protein n=1 Tax=unclassified Vibrio TaxID=2614977 RepID=UPI001361C003|nr:MULTISPECIES: immunoglobulin domain-containing protein [unclassified Vibrio]NAW60075.1 hypothetical protein [Vibrio sp. V36_P2S2PM302]NAX25968.1 hypothetical protein [Vibrio sp. V38_P2S17PM301]NAX30646.1 hypothetical protein [Vibrio sp. V37_P2S8PM304]
MYFKDADGLHFGRPYVMSGGKLRKALEVYQKKNGVVHKYSYIEPPTITTQPVDHAPVAVGKEYSFSLVADSGGGTLSYQWYNAESGVEAYPIKPEYGGNTDSMAVSTINPLDSHPYWCKVSNERGTVNSNTAYVKVVGNPSVIENPTAPGSINLGSSVPLHAEFDAHFGTLNLLWEFNSDAGYETMDGGHGVTVTNVNWKPTKPGQYSVWCSARNEFNKRTTTDTLTIYVIDPYMTLTPKAGGSSSPGSYYRGFGDGSAVITPAFGSLANNKLKDPTTGGAQNFRFFAAYQPNPTNTSWRISAYTQNDAHKHSLRITLPDGRSYTKLATRNGYFELYRKDSAVVQVVFDSLWGLKSTRFKAELV